MVKNKLSKEMVEKYIYGRCYNIVVALLMEDQNINMNKIRIINYILSKNKEGVSINQISKTLGIDYKNVWRYCKQLNEAGIFEDVDIKKGESSNMKIRENAEEEILKENFKKE